jgi:hypothetical protein
MPDQVFLPLRLAKLYILVCISVVHNIAYNPFLDWTGKPVSTLWKLLFGAFAGLLGNYLS